MALKKKPVTGMKDILPAEMQIRDYVLGQIKETYRSFGYSSIETPCVEHIENLLSKQGGDNEKLIFKILKRGDKLQEAIEKGNIFALNKEEKVLYKNLQEAFNTVANMAMVIEERTMDTKQISDLTIGEIHVIEMVNKYNNKPMTLIAKKMHVTVGSLTIGVNRLVQKGYLLRIRDEMDHRVILLSITQLGKKVLKVHDKFHDDILGLVLDSLPLQQVTKVMSQFAYVLELYYDPSIENVEEKKTTRKGKK